VLDSQGLKGQLAEMSISTRVVAPMGTLTTGGHGPPILVAETKWKADLHTFDISVAGDYKICFDNRFSYVIV
jgi:hypothetical protein